MWESTTHKHLLGQRNYCADAKQSKALDSLAEAAWQLPPEQGRQGNRNQESVLRGRDNLIDTLLENTRAVQRKGETTLTK